MSKSKSVIGNTGMKRKSVPKTTRTAYHEAGHAVLACVFGIEFESVSLLFDDDDDFSGCFQIQEGEETKVDQLDARKKRDIMEQYVMVALAGEVSEFLLTGRHRLRDSLSDYLKAYKLVLDLCIPSATYDPDNKEGELYIRWLSERCKNILKAPQNWCAVECLAREIMEHKTIRGWEAVEIIENSGLKYDQVLGEKITRSNSSGQIAL